MGHDDSCSSHALARFGLFRAGTCPICLPKGIQEAAFLGAGGVEIGMEGDFAVRAPVIALGIGRIEFAAGGCAFGARPGRVCKVAAEAHQSFSRHDASPFRYSPENGNFPCLTIYFRLMSGIIPAPRKPKIIPA